MTQELPKGLHLGNRLNGSVSEYINSKVDEVFVEVAVLICIGLCFFISVHQTDQSHHSCNLLFVHGLDTVVGCVLDVTQDQHLGIEPSKCPTQCWLP